MHFRSLEDAARAVSVLAKKLPQPIDLVVGIPRSGLLVANILALTVDVPLTDVQGYLEGRVLASGLRGYSTSLRKRSRTGYVVVIDDSVCTGRAISEARRAVRASIPGRSTIYSALYVTQVGVDFVDQYAEIVPWPRMFQWNILHHELLTQSCMDIDGVLCRDPTDEENDDGDNYRRFLRDATPLVVPRFRVGCLVTARLEKYRRETEEWLARHGVQYERLRMLDVPNAGVRRLLKCHAPFKAQVYSDTKAVMFIESSWLQACAISQISSKPVYCFERAAMCWPTKTTSDGAQEHRGQSVLGRSRRLIKRGLQIVVSRLKQST